MPGARGQQDGGPQGPLSLSLLGTDPERRAQGRQEPSQWNIKLERGHLYRGKEPINNPETSKGDMAPESS